MAKAILPEPPARWWPIVAAPPPARPALAVPPQSAGSASAPGAVAPSEPASPQNVQRYVRYDAAQTLNEAQKLLARQNMGAHGLHHENLTGDLSPMDDGVHYFVAPAPAAGNSAKFSGSEYLTADSLASSITPVTTLRLTLAFKTSVNTGLVSSNILFSLHDSSGGNIMRIGCAPTDGGIYISAEALQGAETSLSAGFNDGQWHTLDLTMTNGSAVVCYVDGTEIASASGAVASVSYASVARVSIGQEWDTNTASDIFDGEIRSVVVYTGATKLADWPLNNLVGEGVYDESGNGHDALLFGGGDNLAFFANNTRQATLTLPAANGTRNASLIQNTNGHKVIITPPSGEKLNGVTDATFASPGPG